jgi:adenylate cyclase
MGLFSELRRRNVFRVALAYIVIAWLILQVGDTLAPALRLPDWVNTALAFFLILGFPLAIFFAWAYELTPEGIKLERDVDRSRSITHLTGRKLDYVIIAVLATALGLFAFDKWALEPSRDAALVNATTYVADQQAPVSSRVSSEQKSIAVLPFVNMSDDLDNEYFSDGISEELLNLLAKVPDLRVIARTSSFSYKGKDVTIADIAHELNVGHVLEGSVRKAGNTVRITAQLILADDSSHIWSQTYDRQLDDIFTVQDEIATAVVDALKIALLGNGPKARQTIPEAYALFLQGRYFFNQGTEESYKQAETLLKQALAIDSGFAPAWAELSEVYAYQAAYNFGPHNKTYELARDAAQQALVVDPEFALGYSCLAAVEMQYDWDFAAAYQHVQQALMLDGDDAYVLKHAADVFTRLGRFDEAIDLYRQSIAVDPVSASPYLNLGRVLYYAGRLDEAEALIQKALSLSPGKIRAHYFLGWVLLAQGDARGALAAMEQENGDYYRLTGIAVVQMALHNASESDAALRKLIEKKYVESSYQIALAYAYRGDIDASFEWLQLAYDTRDSGLNKMLVDPMLANLHSDPRWKPFLNKMGFPH